MRDKVGLKFLKINSVCIVNHERIEKSYFAIPQHLQCEAPSRWSPSHSSDGLDIVEHFLRGKQPGADDVSGEGWALKVICT